MTTLFEDYKFMFCYILAKQIITFSVIFGSLTDSAANTDFPATGIPCRAT